MSTATIALPMSNIVCLSISIPLNSKPHSSAENFWQLPLAQKFGNLPQFGGTNSISSFRSFYGWSAGTDAAMISIITRSTASAASRFFARTISE